MSIGKFPGFVKRLPLPELSISGFDARPRPILNALAANIDPETKRGRTQPAGLESRKYKG